MKVVLFILTCLFLMSCGQHRDGTSVWAGGLFLIPVLEIGGIIVFGLTYYKRKSVGYLWFAIGCFLALLATIWLVNAEKG